MPFKSEAQRKYLWANEPEIARDWTDTYGSRIQKAGGQLVQPGIAGIGRPGYGGPQDWGQQARAEKQAARTGQAGSASNESDRNRFGGYAGMGNQELQNLAAVSPSHGGIGQQPSPVSTGERINERLNKIFSHRKPKNIALRGSYIDKDRRIYDALLAQDKIKETGGVGAWEWIGEGGLGSQAALETIKGLDIEGVDRYTGGYHDVNDPGHPDYDPRGGGEGEQPWLYPPTEIADTGTGSSTASTLGGLDFLVPLKYVKGGVRAAEGGRIGFFKGAQADTAQGKSMSPGTSADYTPGAGHRDSGGPSITGGDGQVAGGIFETKVLQPGLEKAKAKVDRTKAILSGAIGDPDDPSTWNFAQGGRIGYQEGNMVGEEMGGEMESAMMQSKEVIKDLYEALIAQGLSPQEAIEKIKEMLAASQAEEPEAPMMGEEFPGQEFSRAPAAFGGIMDTYTGRRKYGLGSFFKSVKKKIKKLASSKLGKIALMYAAGTYLGGTAAFGGTGWGSGVGATPWKKFGAQLLSPTGGQGIGNIFNPTGGLGKGKGWSVFQKPAIQASTKYGAMDVIDKANRLGSPAAGSDWSKYILPTSIAAGAYTKYAPLDELDDTTEEWDEEKAEWDKYYAGLGGSYRVPEEYVVPSAEGGRIGRQEGGLMDLGGMEKDYREDGGFVPLGGEEKADDVPARLSRNEFVFTADAVKNAGGGDIDRGAQVMENVMKNLEAGGKVSEESQGQGAEEMFEVSERLSEVV